MKLRTWIPIISLVVAASSLRLISGGDENGCPVTKAPDNPFIPPPPHRPSKANDGRFLYGTPALWTIVGTGWSGSKLPFFSREFDWKKENDPRLSVVARRLDGPATLVWSGWVNSGGPPYTTNGVKDDYTDNGFMVTELNLPTAGCWEISARYAPERGRTQNLTYTVRVRQ